MEEMKSEIDSTLEHFRDAIVVNCAESFKRQANKIIDEGLDGVPPTNVLERIIAYADRLIKESAER